MLASVQRDAASCFEVLRCNHSYRKQVFFWRQSPAYKRLSCTKTRFLCYRLSIFSRTGKESSGDGFHLHSGADINLCLTNLLFIAYLACILAPGMGRDCRICPSLQGLLLQGKASGSDRRLPSLQEVLLCLKAHMSRKQLNVMPGRLREPTNKAL